MQKSLSNSCHAVDTSRATLDTTSTTICTVLVEFNICVKMYISFNNYFIFSVNKNNDNFEYNEDPNEFYGHKWTLKTFWKYLEMEGHDTQRIWRRIKNVMIKTVMCGYPDIVQGDKKNTSSLVFILKFQCLKKNARVTTTVTSCLVLISSWTRNSSPGCWSSTTSPQWRRLP